MITLYEIRFPSADPWEPKAEYVCRSCIEDLPSFFFPAEVEYDLACGKTLAAARCPNCGKEND